MISKAVCLHPFWETFLYLPPVLWQDSILRSSHKQWLFSRTPSHCWASGGGGTLLVLHCHCLCQTFLPPSSMEAHSCRLHTVIWNDLLYFFFHSPGCNPRETMQSLAVGSLSLSKTTLILIIDFDIQAHDLPSYQALQIGPIDPISSKNLIFIPTWALTQWLYPATPSDSLSRTFSFPATIPFFHLASSWMYKLYQEPEPPNFSLLLLFLILIPFHLLFIQKTYIFSWTYSNLRHLFLCLPSHWLPRFLLCWEKGGHHELPQTSIIKFKHLSVIEAHLLLMNGSWSHGRPLPLSVY